MQEGSAGYARLCMGSAARCAVQVCALTGAHMPVDMHAPIPMKAMTYMKSIATLVTRVIARYGAGTGVDGWCCALYSFWLAASMRANENSRSSTPVTGTALVCVALPV